MKKYYLRKAASVLVLLFLVVACSDPAPTVTTAQSSIAKEFRQSTSGTLLYASESSGVNVLVFSYPQGKLIQTLSGFAYVPQYLCADSSGDIFVPTTDFKSTGSIYEFAHGASQPTETLTDPGPGYARACSVDPTTGNLAVANEQNVAVYAGATGTPMIYEASDVGASDCAYDNSGNLFVDGHSYDNKIAELPQGGTDFTDITLKRHTGITAHLQWRNGYLVMWAGIDGYPHGPYEIDQLRISGSKGIVTHRTLLYGKSKHRVPANGEFTLYGDTIIMPEGAALKFLDLWHYPRGGKPYAVITSKQPTAFYGTAVSE